SEAKPACESAGAEDAGSGAARSVSSGTNGSAKDHASAAAPAGAPRSSIISTAAAPARAPKASRTMTRSIYPLPNCTDAAQVLILDVPFYHRLLGKEYYWTARQSKHFFRAAAGRNARRSGPAGPL